MAGRLAWLFVAGLVAVAVVAGACGEDDDEGPAGDESPGPEVHEINVTMSDDLTFNPAEIQVGAGQPVRLVIENTGSALHDFSIAVVAATDVVSEGSDAGGHGGAGHEYDLHVAVAGGETGVLEFTPTEAGDYVFVCSEAGHADGGMVGRLVVAE